MKSLELMVKYFYMKSEILAVLKMQMFLSSGLKRRVDL
jgi:hypothetical protein